MGLFCAECGKPMHRTPRSLPQGKAMCQPCRRLQPTYVRFDKHLPPGCLDCGAAKPSLRHRYCEPCRVERRRKSYSGKVKASATDRGYGTEHRRARRVALAAFTHGDPCARCSQPMLDPPTLLDMDHNDDRTGYLGLAHRACNRAARRRPREGERRAA